MYGTLILRSEISTALHSNFENYETRHGWKIPPHATFFMQKVVKNTPYDSPEVTLAHG